MAVKKFFGADGVLVEIELPDQPLPVPVNSPDHSIHQLLNPTNVDPNTLAIDAARVPDLRPTDGAGPATKFPDRPPGDGQGAGVGQVSGLSLRDVWENNPDRIGKFTVDTVQSGPVGSAAAVAPTADVDRVVGGSTKSPAPASDEKPDDTWTKAQLHEFIGEGAPPLASTRHEDLLAAALEAYETKQLA